MIATPSYKSVVFKEPHEASGIIFGKHGNLLVCSPENAEEHGIAIGRTGIGKTLAILVLTLLNWIGTFFTIDIAGDISKNVLIPNKLVYEPENASSTPFYIFAEIDSIVNDDKRNELLLNLAYLIMPDNKRDGSVSIFYKSEGRKILAASLIALYSKRLDFIEICQKIISSSWEDLFAEIVKCNIPKADLLITSFIGAKPENTAGCKQVLDKAITLFSFGSSLAKNIRRPKPGETYFSPDQLEALSVFIVIKDRMLNVYAPVLHIITAQVLSYMSTRENYPKCKILLALDELSSCGKLDLLHSIQTLRKKGVRILALTQSITDLDLVYGRDERRAIMDNFAFNMILSCDDQENAELFSKKIGERTVVKTHLSKSRRMVPVKKRIPYEPLEYTTLRIEETITKHPYEFKERIVPPDELSRLGDDLILLTPDGYMRLKKNFPPRDSIQ